MLRSSLEAGPAGRKLNWMRDDDPAAKEMNFQNSGAQLHAGKSLAGSCGAASTARVERFDLANGATT